MNYRALLLLFVCLVFLVPATSVFASALAGVVNGYAFGSNIGWINLGCDRCHIMVTDTRIVGYAWSDNFGWINFNPDHGGVNNNSAGVLSGYAFGEMLGWINFSGVFVDDSGRFSGTATADNGGSISFDCDTCHTTTDWRYAVSAVRNARSNNGSVTSMGGGTSSPVPLLITNYQETYSLDQSIFISGTGVSGQTIQVQIDDQYGVLQINQDGHWDVNLGKLSEGPHQVTFSPMDDPKNSYPVGSVSFLVKRPIAGALSRSFSSLFRSLSSKLPPPLMTVPNKELLMDQSYRVYHPEIKTTLPVKIQAAVDKLVQPYLASLSQALEDIGLKTLNWWLSMAMLVLAWVAYRFFYTKSKLQPVSTKSHVMATYAGTVDREERKRKFLAETSSWTQEQKDRFLNS